jgi:type I restriction enzyme S subunit
MELNNRVKFKKTEIGLIPEEWNVLSIYNTANWVNGLAFKNISFSNIGKPVIKINELKYGITKQTQFTKDVFKDKYFLNRGDLLFSWSGSPETSIDVFWYSLPDGWLNQHIFKVVPKNEVIVDFLYYILKVNKQRFIEIAKDKQTTGLGHVTIADLKRFYVAIPSIKEQKRIAEILSSLDDKIELNRKINSNLEKIASLLFKQWFIDIKGKDFKIRKLGDFFPIKTGKKDANIATKNGKYPFFTCSQDILFTDNFSFNSSSILLAGNGDFNIKWYEGKFEAYQRTYVLTPYKKELLGFLYFLMKHFLDDITVGHRGSVINFITKGMIEDFEIKIPIYKDFNDRANFFYETIQTIDFYEKEIKNLSRVRDSLLPRLMNGKIRVKI